MQLRAETPSPRFSRFSGLITTRGQRWFVLVLAARLPHVHFVWNGIVSTNDMQPEFKKFIHAGSSTLLRAGDGGDSGRVTSATTANGGFIRRFPAARILTHLSGRS